MNEYLQQFVDLEDILANSELAPEGWYSSHPFSPLRIKALELFRRSET
jgi:Zn-dependent protease with chaperone function